MSITAPARRTGRLAITSRPDASLATPGPIPDDARLSLCGLYGLDSPAIIVRLPFRVRIPVSEQGLPATCALSRNNELLEERLLKPTPIFFSRTCAQHADSRSFGTLLPAVKQNEAVVIIHGRARLVERC